VIAIIWQGASLDICNKRKYYSFRNSI